MKACRKGIFLAICKNDLGSGDLRKSSRIVISNEVRDLSEERFLGVVSK
jgi:hypothetical protein